MAVFLAIKTICYVKSYGCKINKNPIHTMKNKFCQYQAQSIKDTNINTLIIIIIDTWHFFVMKNYYRKKCIYSEPH